MSSRGGGACLLDSVPRLKIRDFWINSVICMCCGSLRVYEAVIKSVEEVFLGGVVGRRSLIGDNVCG